MKKICYLLLIVGLFSSCVDLEEDPKGRVAPEAFFSNEVELNMALTGMYSWLNETFFMIYHIEPLMGGDDMMSERPALQQHDVFIRSGANPEITRFWKESYKAIQAANNVILNYERVNASEKVKNEGVGQAYFVRAFMYFYLVRIYNRLPLIMDLGIDFNVGKSGPEEIYKVIVDDLLKAEKMLPDSWSDTRKGIVVNAGAAKSLLASVYLTMAGYPLKDASKYVLAAQKAKEVIDNEAVYGYRLLDDCADLWTRKRINDETVFGIYYSVILGGGNQHAPFASMPIEYTGWYCYFPEITFFNAFPEGSRKEATFATKLKIPKDDKVVEIDWEETIAKHPCYKKMWDIDGLDWDRLWVYVDWQSSRTVMAIRYAEVLLTYAEAQAMSSGPDVTAYSAVNRIRKRAGLPDLPAGLSKEAFRDSVVAERGWEFAGAECCARWFDLVRLERVEEANSHRSPLDPPLVNQPTKEHYFSVIPDDEVLKNPNLKD